MHRTSDLLEAAARGARAAWKAVGAPQNAHFDEEDLVQEGMLRVWAQKDGLQGAAGDRARIAHRVGYRGAVDFVRKQWGRGDRGTQACLGPEEEDLRPSRSEEYDLREFLCVVGGDLIGQLRKTARPTKTSAAMRFWLGDGMSRPAAASAAGITEACLTVAFAGAKRNYLATTRGRAAKAVA